MIAIGFVVVMLAFSLVCSIIDLCKSLREKCRKRAEKKEKEEREISNMGKVLK
jgi:hypothetical protein